jgi:hypothetical protein
MKADEPIAAYEFRGGAFRGTTLTLFPGRLAHEGVDVVESIPIAHVASVRVEFRREARKLNWSIALFALALVLFVAAGPLQAWSAAAAAEVTEQAQRENTTAVSGVLQSTFRTLDQFGRLLPMAGGTLVACAAALCFSFGSAALRLRSPSPPSGQRRSAGRDQQLFEFAEELSVRLGEKR